MDAYDLMDKMKRLWSQHSSKNSGEINKNSEALNLYVTTPYGVYKMNDVYYDPHFGLMLNTEKNNDKENA
jgi:hypothetical protein